MNKKYSLEITPSKILIQNERMRLQLSTATTTTRKSELALNEKDSKINIDLIVSGGTKDGYFRVTCESGKYLY